MDPSRPTIPTMKVECAGCGKTLEVAQQLHHAGPPSIMGHEEDPLSITFNKVDIDDVVIHATQYICSDVCRAAIKQAFAG